MFIYEDAAVGFYLVYLDFSRKRHNAFSERVSFTILVEAAQSNFVPSTGAKRTGLRWQRRKWLFSSFIPKMRWILCYAWFLSDLMCLFVRVIISHTQVVCERLIQLHSIGDKVLISSHQLSVKKIKIKMGLTLKSFLIAFKAVRFHQISESC